MQKESFMYFGKSHYSRGDVNEFLVEVNIVNIYVQQDKRFPRINIVNIYVQQDKRFPRIIEELYKTEFSHKFSIPISLTIVRC